jgi:hypothetical protein
MTGRKRSVIGLEPGIVAKMLTPPAAGLALHEALLKNSL